MKLGVGSGVFARVKMLVEFGRVLTLEIELRSSLGLFEFGLGRTVSAPGCRLEVAGWGCSRTPQIV